MKNRVSENLRWQKMLADNPDLQKAVKIVASRHFIGERGAMKRNIAVAVAEGIALGRKEAADAMLAAALRP